MSESTTTTSPALTVLWGATSRSISPQLHSLAPTLSAVNRDRPLSTPRPKKSAADTAATTARPPSGLSSPSSRSAPIAHGLPVERIETRSLPALTHVLPPTSTSRFSPSMSLASPRLHSLAATLAALPSMSSVPRAPFRSYADTRSSARSDQSNERGQTLPGRDVWSACHYSCRG
jgi:hypothetical protein